MAAYEVSHILSGLTQELLTARKTQAKSHEGERALSVLQDEVIPVMVRVLLGALEGEGREQQDHLYKGL